MPLYESTELNFEQMVKRAKRDMCSCGGNLTVAWSAEANRYCLRCANNIDHWEFVRPHKTNNYDLPGYNMPGVIKRKVKNMMQKYGEERTKAMVRVAGGNPIATLTQKGASEMLGILYPKATQSNSGKAAIVKAALVCRDYGLNPAMDHLFLIEFSGTWAVVRGIKASRLICGREKSYGYVDDSPRVMTPDEQMRIYGEVDEKSIVTICKLKDKDGNTFAGYGKWPKGTKPYGTEKGNSMFNMSAIRAERQALDKLNPGAMPADVDVVDERFIETPSKVVVSEVKPEPATQLEEGKQEDITDIPLDPVQPPTPEPQQEVPTKPVEGHPELPPEATESTRKASTEQTSTNGVSFDFDWLREQMKVLNWKVITLASWFKPKAEFKDMDWSGSLEQIVGRMSESQQKSMVAIIQAKVDEK